MMMIPTRPVAALLPHILPYAATCSEPMAIQAAVQAAIRFCERTRLWRYSDEFGVGPGGDIICVPNCAAVHEIDEARYGEARLEPISLADLERQWPGWQDASGEPPLYVLQTAPDTVRMVPDGAGSVTLRLILKPHPDAYQLPRFLVDSHRETIVAGALARLLLIPDQKFSDPELAAAFAGSFHADLDRLMTAELRGQQRAPLRTRAQYL